MGALTGSCPAGQARSGLGASRCDPARSLAARIAELLHPQRGIKRGIIDRIEPGKGSPDSDKMLVPVSVAEIREVHAVLTAVTAQFAGSLGS